MATRRCFTDEEILDIGNYIIVNNLCMAEAERQLHTSKGTLNRLINERMYNLSYTMFLEVRRVAKIKARYLQAKASFYKAQAGYDTLLSELASRHCGGCGNWSSGFCRNLCEDMDENDYACDSFY